MAKSGFLLVFLISFILMFTINLWSVVANENRKAYIVYMGSLPEGEYLTLSHHVTMLQGVVESSSVSNLLIRSYKRSFNGFAAKLTNQEAKKLASMKGVVSVFQSRTLQLLTTRSWDFMGFNETSNHSPAAESDVIIGVIDTGIWPESASFQDEAFGLPPNKWKGVCKGGKNFTCNNKIIGARFYSSSTPSAETARDDDGHGSHTASTAAGNKVNGVSFFGLAQGTARGAVPSARIAAYKVCHPEGCASVDILAAFDDAIADGVDIITVSLGGDSALDFHHDPIAIGAFHAMEKGILTLNSAGNNGLSGLQSVTSVAPWMVTVAASSTDRQFIDKVILGDGTVLTGFSVNSFNLSGQKFPLIYGQHVSRGCSDIQAMLCQEGCVDRSLAEGKIVLCDQFKGNFKAHEAGAVGSIVLSGNFENLSTVVSLPALALSTNGYDFVKSYVNSTQQPEAEILKSEVIEDPSAPVVAIFSSRGPNSIVPDILKPDLTAPGVNILAAYSPLGSPSNDLSDKRQVEYNIVSGTSMSCPHAAGVAAYVKTFHSNWSPSAIQSALMTTAWAMDGSKNQDGEFAYGSGHINPVKAIDPGLVYEASKQDYIKLMCSIGYASDSIRAISGDNSSCPETSQNVPPKDLNYPSITALVPSSKSFTVNFHRTVTNVGLANSTYKAQVVSPNSGLNVEVVPQILSFNSSQEKKSFDVIVSGEGLKPSAMISASLVWSDGIHTVRSPIVVHTIQGIRLISVINKY